MLGVAEVVTQPVGVGLALVPVILIMSVRRSVLVSWLMLVSLGSDTRDLNSQQPG